MYTHGNNSHESVTDEPSSMQDECCGVKEPKEYISSWMDEILHNVMLFTIKSAGRAGRGVLT
jgi:hypothetical protein